MQFISSWVQGIIITVAIATILEMILPNGNSKKYIITVIGIFIVFNIISPIVNKITGESINMKSIINIEKYIDVASKYETNVKDIDNDKNIKEVYVLNLKKEIKNTIESNGYMVNSIYIDLDEYKIKKLKLAIHKLEKIEDRVNGIEDINIEVDLLSKKQNKITSLNMENKNEIKNFLNSQYGIEKNIIFINE